MNDHADWRDGAACVNVDPDLFFPVGTGRHETLQVAEANSVCQTCLVRGQCLSWALDQGISSGIWGGTTGDDRRAIRRATAASR